jgi:hypothetical protein
MLSSGICFAKLLALLLHLALGLVADHKILPINMRMCCISEGIDSDVVGHTVSV